MSGTLSRRLRGLVVALLATAPACQDDPEPEEFFAFVRPQHLAFACYDTQNPESRPAGFEPDPDAELVVPLHCCSLEPSEDDETCGVSPRLHALVSQTRRGEVAAVNIRPGPGASSVIDGDPAIPGFTFTDVGELPAAVVVPERDLVDPDLGPRWTYIASAGEREIRAVATCRFRRGQECGPEDELQDDFSAAELLELTRVQLPSEPVDMVLDGQGYLWISLPEEDALGRVRLNGAEGPDPMLEGGAVEPARPFVPGEDGEVLQLFPLDGTLETTELPLVQDDAYTAWCGLGIDDSFPGDTLERPAASLNDLDAGAPDAGELPDGGADAGAPDAAGDGGADAGPPEGRVQPGRLRYDPATNLILASDRVRPLIHAWRLQDGMPQPITAIATGAPIRDFALTGEVPPSVDLYVDGEANLDGDFPPDSVRYIYAIDDRDGSVLAIRWEPEAGNVELVKPQGPVPYADRIYLGGELARTIEVIDTRGNDPGECATVLPAGGDPTETSRAQSPGSMLRGVFLAVSTADAQLFIVDVHDQDLFCEAFGTGEEVEPDPDREVTQYRGTGRCDIEAQEDIAQEDDGERGDGLSVQTNEPPLGMAVRRHSLRLEEAPEVAILTANDNALGVIECAPGYMPAYGATTDGSDGEIDDPQVCVNSDPWMQFGGEWTAQYEGLVPGFVDAGGRAQGYFVPESREADTARFAVATGFDMCARGVVDADALNAEEGDYEGDYLVLPRDPPPGAPEECQLAATADPPRFPIREAYDSYLVVGERTDADGDQGRMSLSQAIGCFGPNPEAGAPAAGFTTFNVAVNDRHLVLAPFNLRGFSSGYFHRVTSDDAGRCVLDEQLDPRLRARLQATPPGGACDAEDAFQNPFVMFCLQAEGGGATALGGLALSFSVQRSPFSLNVPLTFGLGEGRAALPATLEYLPETRELYSVDAADEGLLQLSLRPLALEASFR